MAETEITPEERELLERKQAEVVQRRADLGITGTHGGNPRLTVNSGSKTDVLAPAVMREIQERAQRMAATAPAERVVPLRRVRRPQSDEDLRKAMLRHGVYLEHLDAKLDDFQDRAEDLRAFLRGEDACGLFVTGNPGTGKTRLLAALLREALFTGKSVIYVRAYPFFQRVFATYGGESRESTNEAIEDFSRSDLLLLDDLGHEGKASEAKLCLLHEVISRRNGNRRLTAISTNLPLGDLGERYDGSISSRLGAWRPAALIGEDRRQQL